MLSGHLLGVWGLFEPLFKPMLGCCQLDPEVLQWSFNRMQISSVTKMRMKMSSAKRRPFCPGESGLKTLYGRSSFYFIIVACVIWVLFWIDCSFWLWNSRILIDNTLVIVGPVYNPYSALGLTTNIIATNIEYIPTICTRIAIFCFHSSLVLVHFISFKILSMTFWAITWFSQVTLVSTD